MAKVIGANLVTKGWFRSDGVAETPSSGGTEVTVLQKDSSGNILYASGTTVPSDNESGYAKGCLFIDTDVAAGTTGIYENVGTTTAANFDTIGSGGGITAISQASDTSITTPSSGQLLIYDGTNSWDNKSMSGDGAIDNAGALTVSDLTIASEARGDLLMRGASAWARLAPGTNGYILRANGAAADLTWQDPATLPTGIATGLSSSFTIEGGTYDPATTVTTQTTGAAALTIPDLANTAQEWMFTKVAQTVLNKTLDDATCKFGDTADATKDVFFSLGGATTAKTSTLTFVHTDDRAITFPDATTTLVGTDTTDTLTNKTLTAPIIATGGKIVDAGGDEYMVFTEATTPVTYIGITSGDTGVAPRVQGAGESNTDLHLLGSGTGNVVVSDGTDPTKDLLFELNGATTAKTMSIISSQTDDRSLTLPDATDTLVGKATTDVFTNKSYDCDGSGNALTNVNMDEMDPVAVPSAGDASDSVYGVTGVIMVDISNQGAAVNVYSSNAPFKFIVIDAWSQNLSADGGTWKLDNGTNDLCSAVTVAASDDDLDRAADLDDAYTTIAANGSLRVVPDAGGALDCYIFIKILRLS